MNKALALLAIFLMLIALGGCRTTGPLATATGQSNAVPDFIQVGGVYLMVVSGLGPQVKVLEVRPDGWIRVEIQDEWSRKAMGDVCWVNINQVIFVVPR